MRIRIAVIIFCIVIMLVLTSLVESFNHNRTDTPQKVDVIIVVGGDNGRMEKAAELYQEGYAEYVIITPVIESIYSQSKEFALDLGLPDESIIEEDHATSTYTNATKSFEIMNERGFDSALVVTSDYHLKRTQMIYNRVNDEQYNLKYIAALSANGETWDERSHASRLWFTEFYKLWGYRLGLYNFMD